MVKDGDGRFWDIQPFQSDTKVRAADLADTVQFTVDGIVRRGRLEEAVADVLSKAERRVKQGDWEPGKHYDA